jgi:hypothetical protein
MLQYIEALAKLSAIFSESRLTHQRRLKIARALVQLHENLDEVLANARLILKNKPDDFGGIEVDISLLEKQVRALLETQRLLSKAPLRSVLRIKWKPLPRFRAVSEGKGYILVLALGAFYRLLPNAKAEAEVNAYSLQQFRKDNPGDTDWPGIFDADQKGGLVPFEEGLREVSDGERVPVLGTPRQYREAKQRVAELSRLAEDLREFISREFKPEELS